MDIPNDRSLHDKPTPTGGGLSISLCILLYLVFAWWVDFEVRELVVGLGIGGAMVSIIGWLDDHKPIPALLRMLVYFFATCWVVYWLDGVTTLRIGEQSINLGYP